MERVYETLGLYRGVARCCAVEEVLLAERSAKPRINRRESIFNVTWMQVKATAPHTSRFQASKITELYQTPLSEVQES